ncbi:MAG TPA: PPE family protein, partial [Mycobacterium sp.]|nr:PPE family protein [Mycobacterium sp.]
MTAPIWMAAPPEVHSALLSSGPGPGSLLAAAGAWNSLSAEYSSAAEELSDVLASVQAGVWQGSSAESYVAANLLYLAWLTQASADSAAAAARHETAAGAYSAALSAMPTLAELAANHAVHAVLVATNFFGINTIPIALNEVDYVRMWIQAATTMTTYQAVASAAVESAPQTTPAPQILKTAASISAQTGTQGTGLGTLLNELADKLGLAELVDKLAIDHIFDFLNNPVGYTEQVIETAIERFISNPIAALINPLHLFFDGDELFYPLGYAITPATAGGLAIAPVASVGGLAGLAELTAAEPASTAAPALEPVAAEPMVLPVAGTTSTVLASAGAAGTPLSPPSAPMASAVATAAPPPAPPAAVGTGFVPPYVVGPPGIGFDSGMRTSASFSAKRKTPEPDSAAVAAAAAARQQRQARRRRRTILRDHGNQFADMNIEVDPDWGAPPDDEPLTSGNGAGSLGFAGTVRNEAVEQAAGLTTLAGDEFGGGPTVPMMP